jgi:translation initiation factor 1
VLQPGEQTAVVRLERRAKGKSVTAVSGLDPVASDLPALLKKLKAQCGAGGTIDQHLHMIEVQGDHRERVSQLLRELGYKVKA